MGHLWRTAGNWASAFGRNLMAEFDGNEKLKSICERMAREWMVCKDLVKSTWMCRAGRKMVEVSSDVMRASDASIGLGLEASGVFGLVEKGLAGRQRLLQKRLDTILRIPQYYGGVRDSEGCGESGGEPSWEKAGGLVKYREGMMKRVWRLYSLIRSRVNVLKNDGSIEEIENRQVPMILRNMTSERRLASLCTEEGMGDLRSLAVEIGNGAGKGLRVADIRKISTSGSDRKKMFESQFEAEIVARNVDGSCSRHVFLMKGRFVSGVAGSGRQKWYLSSLVWTRIA